MQRFNHINDMYHAMVFDVMELGAETSPRGMLTKEVVGETYVLNRANRNILVNKVRACNYQFMLAEWLWISLGRNDLTTIGPYNSQMAQFAEGGRFRGAYGPQFVEQVGYVVDKLKDDPHSRQAVMSFWRPRPRDSKDIPCTLDLQFMMRGDPDDAGKKQLDLLVNMRSNDVWLGAPYDIFTFTMIQQQLADLLNANIGAYYHHVGSLHIYERHYEKAAELRKTPVNEWRPNMNRVGEIPPVFQTMFLGMTWMSEFGDKSIESWLEMNAETMAHPWGDLIRVLAYRFCKKPRIVPNFWWKVMHGDVSEPQPEAEG